MLFFFEITELDAENHNRKNREIKKNHAKSSYPERQDLHKKKIPSPTLHIEDGKSKKSLQVRLLITRAILFLSFKKERYDEQR